MPTVAGDLGRDSAALVTKSVLGSNSEFEFAAGQSLLKPRGEIQLDCNAVVILKRNYN